jgi:hypothetical protein
MAIRFIRQNKFNSGYFQSYYCLEKKIQSREKQFLPDLICVIVLFFEFFSLINYYFYVARVLFRCFK